MCSSLVSVSVPNSDVQFKAEPRLALEFVLRVIIVKCFVIFRNELPGVAGILKENRQLQLSFHPLRSVNEVDQIKPLVDAAVPEQGRLDWIFVDDY